MKPVLRLVPPAPPATARKTSSKVAAPNVHVVDFDADYAAYWEAKEAATDAQDEWVGRWGGRFDDDDFSWLDTPC